MVKLAGYENTFYPDRWGHKGYQICELNERNFLFFTHKTERVFGIEDEIMERFSSLEEAEKFLDRYDETADLGDAERFIGR